MVVYCLLWEPRRKLAGIRVAAAAVTRQPHSLPRYHLTRERHGIAGGDEGEPPPYSVAAFGCRWVYKTKVNHVSNKTLRARAYSSRIQYGIELMGVVGAFLINDTIDMQAPEDTKEPRPEIDRGAAHQSSL